MFIDKLEYIWRKMIGFMRDLEIMSHEEHLEGMRLFILEKNDLREKGDLVLFEGLLSERLDFTFVSTGRLRSGVVF